MTSSVAMSRAAKSEVVGETCRRHRHQEVLRFFRKVEKQVPKGQEIHIILDNYATHKHAKVREWAAEIIEKVGRARKTLAAVSI